MESHLRVLLTGATGLIGSAVLAALHGDGHEVLAVVRSAASASRLPDATRCVAIDIGRARTPADWLPHLAGIEAVVNCAGVLQDSPRDSTAGVHVEGAAALFAACERVGVRRVVHVSAMGVDRDVAVTAFARTKLIGDQALMGRDLDWVILRPSLVVGRAAYGGSALFRGLAALPVVPSVAGTGPLQVVQLDDLVRTILFFLQPTAPTRMALEIVGPERLTFDDVLLAYRRWLGRAGIRVVKVPRWMSDAMFRVGDLLGLLGWRPPMRSTARQEIERGNVGDAGAWMRLTGIMPRTLGAALAAEPASVQERWFAQLYFLKPLALAVLALYWLSTGLIALGPGAEPAAALMKDAGLPAAQSLAVASSLADILIGVGIAVRRSARPALLAALALSLAYVVLGTVLMPRLWADPLGPLLKIAPVVVLNLVALAILDDR
jgi:uncharacterized protein YbjT (DUF2867 family)